MRGSVALELRTMSVHSHSAHLLEQDAAIALTAAMLIDTKAFMTRYFTFVSFSNIFQMSFWKISGNSYDAFQQKSMQHELVKQTVPIFNQYCLELNLQFDGKLLYKQEV